MSRTVAVGTAGGDIAAQIAAKLQGNPDLMPPAAGPGIVPGTEPRKGKQRTAGDVKGPGTPGSELERPQAAEDQFLKVAQEKLEASDREVDRFAADLSGRKTPRRGLLLDEPEEAATETKERDESGKFVSGNKAAAAKKDADEEPAKPVEGADEEEDVSATPDEVDDDDADDDVAPSKPVKMTHEKALALLRLDGFKSKALEKLSPEDAIELASHRAKVRSGVEAMASELATLKKAAATTPKATDSATASPATSTTGFDVKAATKRFRETYGETEAVTVEEPIAALFNHFDSTLKSEKQALQPLIAAVGRLQMDFARSRLEKVSPELADNAVWDRVVKKARKMDLEAYGGDVVAVLEDASSIVLPKVRSAKSTEAERASRVRGSPATDSRREAPVPMSKHDAFGAIAAAIDAGDTEEVDRLRRSI